MPDIRTVRAARDDLEALVPLFDAYRSFYGRPADAPGARAFLTERLTRGESVVFLAVALARPIGFTQLYPAFSSVRLGRLWILNDLFVLPEARRSGAGRALLGRAERWAVETGAVGLTLATQLTNEPARRLYESCGWAQDTEFLHYTRIVEPRPRGQSPVK